MSNSDKHFEMAIDIARDALKYLFVFNAGASTSLIALTDKLPNERDYTLAVILFGTGALSVIFSFVFGYFSQLFYANHILENSKNELAAASSQHCLHKCFQAIAIIFVVISLASGSMGLWTAFLEARR